MRKYNIIFGESALGTFRQAQRLLPSLEGEIISFCDDLSLGPLFFDIEEMIETRKTWSEGVFHHIFQIYGEKFESEYNYLIKVIETLEQEDVIIIWSANGVVDKCGSLFMQYMLRDKDCSVYEINASSVDVISRLGKKIEIRDVGQLNIETLGPLIGSERLISKPERENNVNVWIKLVFENKELRVFELNNVLNVEDTYYDSLILRYTENEYKKSMRVIGGALGNCGQKVNDNYLMWRVRRLLEQGILKYRLASNEISAFAIKK